MTVLTPDWEKRCAQLWARLDDYDDPSAFRAEVDGLAAELPEGSAIGYFERACAHDSTGQGEQAVPLYRQALAAGLTGIRRRRAVIQMASTLRALGHPQLSLELLTAEQERGSDELDEATRTEAEELATSKYRDPDWLARIP